MAKLKENFISMRVDDKYRSDFSQKMYQLDMGASELLRACVADGYDLAWLRKNCPDLAESISNTIKMSVKQFLCASCNGNGNGESNGVTEKEVRDA